MARKMRKFSAGGAQGKYDRRMADIKKDFTKDSAGKSGKALEVLEAKRMQRTADAEDDRAKRTGADRTATRAAERAAESNLTKTRKYGAPQAVSKAPDVKLSVTESLSVPKMDSSIGAKPAAKAVQKPAAKPSTAFRAVGDAANARQKAKIGASNAPSDQGFSSKSKVLGTSTTSTGKGGVNSGRSPGILSGVSFGELGGYKGRGNISVQPREARQTSSSNNAANDAAAATRLAAIKKAAEAPGASAVAKDRYKRAVSSGMYAKGGKIKKYAAGGVTKEMPSSKAMGSMNMAKGGKAKTKPAAKAKGKSFAATKFGAAMMKKGADAKGRAMPKFAKGGSIDGCAVKGKTKGRMMAKGGKTC